MNSLKIEDGKYRNFFLISFVLCHVWHLVQKPLGLESLIIEIEQKEIYPVTCLFCILP